MSPQDHRLILFRHGQTEWSKTGQHTGRTELDLTEVGRREAAGAAQVFADLGLDDPLVVSSPRGRARITAELAGLSVAQISPLLTEWDYGDYEGLTTPQIRESDPDWLVWTHGAPGGESVDDVAARADDAVGLAMSALDERDVVFVGHGHFSRAVIARWLELPISEGIRFAMAAASVAVCGWEHGTRQLGASGLTGAAPDPR